MNQAFVDNTPIDELWPFIETGLLSLDQVGLKRLVEFRDQLDVKAEELCDIEEINHYLAENRDQAQEILKCLLDEIKDMKPEEIEKEIKLAINTLD